ncbi:hypothetical protein BSL78_21899 [Apostichopus japonicus]|uniref:CARDB domain-containing protein n=1 Tax=Stichopus japonicus TaxID=307972 RepID=A0A2G8JZU3_STIJA|nr:hypothetical protein BSL78_21899 [Apostichopus japonicus]
MRPTDFSNNTNELLSFRCASYRDTCQFVCGYNSSNFEPTYHPCTSPYMIFGLINNIQYQFSLIATDDVGNTGEEVTISWIVDNEAPVVSNLSTAFVTCGAPTHPNITGVPIVTDNQDFAPLLTFVDDFTPDCSISRVWKATDAAGNSATSRQSLVIDIILPPQINIPTFRLLACDDNLESELDILNPQQVGTPVFHPCGHPLRVTFSDDVAVKQCGSEFTRFWTVMDDCGNVVGAQQRIQILELVLPESPANGEVNVALTAFLSWPSYPGAISHRVYIWRYEDERPMEPAKETTELMYRPSSPYPHGARMLWQVEYVIAGEVTIVPSPIWGFITRSFPDLTVGEIVIPDFAFSGQAIAISWEVSNVGQMGVPGTGRLDYVYFSLLPDPTDLEFSNFEYVERFVDPGDGHIVTSTWILPEDLVGTYFVFVETDVSRAVEDIDRSNNLIRSDGTVEIRLTPPPDLQVSDVIVPSSSFSGLEIEVRWSVDNVGFGVTRGAVWFDQISLSSDGVLDRQDHRLATVRHDGILSVGSGYSGIATVIPERVFGTFQVIVETDVSVLFTSTYLKTTMN